MKDIKDPYAAERAIVQKKIKSLPTSSVEDLWLKELFAPLISAFRGDLVPLLEKIKGEKGDKGDKGNDGITPKRGVDYFTKNDIELMEARILDQIKLPEQKDAELDQEMLRSFVRTYVAEAIKNEDLKEDIVNMERVKGAFLDWIAPFCTTADMKAYVDEKLRKELRGALRPNVVAGFSSLGAMTDVILTGVPKDAKGNYILTPGGGSFIVETPTGAVNGTNPTFTVTATPAWIVADGVTYYQGAGYSLAGLTVTMDIPPSSFIRSIR